MLVCVFWVESKTFKFSLEACGSSIKVVEKGRRVEGFGGLQVMEMDTDFVTFSLSL